MAISKKVLNYLEKMKYKFSIIEHKTTYTAFDTARTTKKKEKKLRPEEVVKALVMKADKNHLLALVSASKRLDKKKLLKTINARKKKGGEKLVRHLDFAKEAWMKKNIPGKVGAIPAFRGLLGMEMYVDATLAKQKNVYLGSGEYEYSIKIPIGQYLKNEKLVKGAFGGKR